MSSKRGKLNIVETTFIEAKRDTLSAEEIAKLLDRTKNAICKYLESNPRIEKMESQEQTVKPPTAAEIDGLARYHPVRDEVHDKLIGAVMSRNASEVADTIIYPKKDYTKHPAVHNPKRK